MTFFYKLGLNILIWEISPRLSKPCSWALVYNHHSFSPGNEKGYKKYVHSKKLYVKIQRGEKRTKKEKWKEKKEKTILNEEET